LEATPAELWQKSSALIEELAQAFSGVNPDLAETLEKALPPKEQTLKYPVLRGLRAITTKEYEAMLKRMLADIGKVLNQSVNAPTGTIEKSGKLEKQEEGEEPLEPGDVDPETGDLIPEEEEEEEEEEEGEGEEKSLEKAAPGGVERTYKVRGHPEVIDQLDALLLIARTLGSWGASRDVTISVDGDGPHFLEVEGIERELPKGALDGQIDKAEIKAYLVELKKSWQKTIDDFNRHIYSVPSVQKAEASQAQPLQHDFTQPIAQKDGRAYRRVKSVLMKRGYTEADFEEGGTLYGYSVNELIDIVRDERKSG
jgi:hypothetical protein